VHEPTDEELLLAIAASPGAIGEFYLRHVAKVTGMGVRRFDNAEDVADFVATVFLEVLRSAGGFDPRRGRAVAWLYGLAGNRPGPKDPPTKDGGPIRSLDLSRVSAISVTATDADGDTVAHGITSPDWVH
jgi:hypothetical protein